MTGRRLSRVYFFCVWGLLCCTSQAQPEALTPELLLQQLNDYPHAQQMAFSEQQVIDYELGLGALQKVRGAWRFKQSERVSGLLLRYTWQIVDGFTSREVMENLQGSLDKEEGAVMLFTCDGRACGHGAQWANRVFQQRTLYGMDDLQRYRVYSLQGESAYRLVIYSSSRTADRQYLHIELLRLSDE
jgi:hypothetical protein